MAHNEDKAKLNVSMNVLLRAKICPKKKKKKGKKKGGGGRKEEECVTFSPRQIFFFNRKILNRSMRFCMFFVLSTE